MLNKKTKGTTKRGRNHDFVGFVFPSFILQDTLTYHSRIRHVFYVPLDAYFFSHFFFAHYLHSRKYIYVSNLLRDAVCSTWLYAVCSIAHNFFTVFIH